MVSDTTAKQPLSSTHWESPECIQMRMDQESGLCLGQNVVMDVAVMDQCSTFIPILCVTIFVDGSLYGFCVVAWWMWSIGCVDDAKSATHFMSDSKSKTETSPEFCKRFS